MQATARSLVPVGAAALAGKATCLAGAVGAGLLAVGDDRGEVSLWSPDGRPLGGFRMPSRIASVSLSADGSQLAAVDECGRVRVTDAHGDPVFDLAVPGALLVRTSPKGDCHHVIDPAHGRVLMFSSHGQSIREFDVPQGVIGYVLDTGDGSPSVLTRMGLLVRYTPWGRQSWARDFATPAADLAVDRKDALLSVGLHRRGADNLLPESGVRFGNFAPGFPVAAVALLDDHVVLGGPGGALELLTRTGSGVARCDALGNVIRMVAFEDGPHVAALLTDGHVRMFGPDNAAAGAAPQPAGVTVAALHGPAPQIVFRHPVAGPADEVAPIRLALASDGGAVAVAHGRRLMVLDAAGDVLEDDRLEGSVLALRLDSGRAGLLVTTREIRPLLGGSSAQRQQFFLTAVEACVPADGSSAAVLDEYGGVRLIDRDTGEDLVYDLGLAETPARRIAGFGRGVCVQLANRVFRLLAPGSALEFEVEAADGALPRLAAALPIGPVVVRGGQVIVTAWDGTPAWTSAPGPEIGEVLVGTEGQLLVSGPFGVVALGGGGALRGRRQRVQGRVAHVTGGERDPVLVIVDGGRVVLATSSGRALWHVTFDDEVRAACAVKRGELLAAVVGHDVVLVRGPGAQARSAEAGTRSGGGARLGKTHADPTS